MQYLWAFHRTLKNELHGFRIYLKNIDTDYAETFLKTGEWPDEIQIPKNASVLNKDGSINWTKAAKGGYKLDKDGNPIKEKFIPKIGEVIDRYGPANGRYTSPIIDGKSFEYTERSLPYVENLSNYHKYEVIGDFSKIEEYVKNCPDAKLKAQVEAIVKKYYKGDYSRLASYKGEAAAVEGWGKGGAIQYELSLTVEQLERLGLLREINQYGGQNMKIEDARKIIQEEGLQGYNLCEERENRENEVVLKKENEKWIVYVTDERASKIINSVDKYNTEAEAIEDFIERLRADKVLREL